MKGIDCAAPLTAEKARKLASEGMQFACRYVVPPKYTWKRLTKEEVAVITAAGMRIGSVFETGANRPKDGALAGLTDGGIALQEAKLVGQPLGTAIYFAVDYDAQPADYSAIEDYLRAADGQINGYNAGVYGSYSVVEEMARRGACKHFWQTYAWSGGKKSSRANIYQYKNGVRFDDNESYGNEGFWGVKKISEEDAEKIIRFLAAGYGSTEDPEAREEFHRLADEVRKAAGMEV
ncbi:MAG: DUF1906 domain-containing protein [Candidatus Thermoplasmatota archaeon]|nr:DUF1906 domain-containing protein [Candidatus Thermoplasmatota archaeon]